MAEVVEDFIHRGKNLFNEHWQKEQQNSPPLVKKQKPSDQSAGHDVLSGSVTPEPAADCHRMAAEAVADVAHGWHVLFVVGVYSMIRRM